jgi:UDP-N-acetyl-2-amino-2-deoxyglucuronate dehydrogenase
MIHFAIVGLGHIGKRHAEHIQQNTNCTLVAVCDANPVVGNGLSIPFYTQIEDMLAAEKIDVVCICTPNYLHSQQTIIALKAQCHVVIEKPMALSVAECD